MIRAATLPRRTRRFVDACNQHGGGHLNDPDNSMNV